MGYHKLQFQNNFQMYAVAGSLEQSKRRCKRRFAPPKSSINFIPGKVIQQNQVQFHHTGTPYPHNLKHLP